MAVRDFPRRHGDHALFGELAGIAEQVGENLSEFGGIIVKLGKIIHFDHFQPIPLFLQQECKGFAHQVDYLAGLKVLAVKGHLAGLDL